VTGADRRRLRAERRARRHRARLPEVGGPVAAANLQSGSRRGRRRHPVGSGYTGRDWIGSDRPEEEFMPFFRAPRHASLARSLPLLLLIALTIGGGGRSVSAQEGDEAAALLERAATAMAELETFHFELSTPRGRTVFLEGLELAGLEGDVQRPESFRASATARAAIVELSVDVVGIGSRVWVTDPMQEGRQFRELDVSGVEGEGGASLVDLLNPDRVLLEAVSFIEEPAVAGEDEIDGAQTTRVDGTFDLSRLQAEGTPVPGLRTDRPLPVSIWIDEEGRVRRLELEGPLTTAEMPDVVRRLDLTDFNEAIEIEPPV
jgi:hypothetical protein